MKIVTEAVTIKELKDMAAGMFGNLVKAVVDVEKEIIAIDAELHADEEALLLKNGSKQENLWGINIYPDLPKGDRIEFDSMINLRPRQGNKTRNVDDLKIRNKIIEIVNKLVEDENLS
ncbi:MAG: hypothetical protein H8E13_15080 [Actinobacteria bacterium]|nr:hypothetical protein [Actinomycetota bacterium]